ncbi:MAG: hypothetical protein OXH94_12315 [Rhodospirillales bacterium]|nr:hypothetical protein [Rhodospirillales bacterium]
MTRFGRGRTVAIVIFFVVTGCTINFAEANPLSEKEELTKHVQTIFNGETIYRWEQPVRFQLIGLSGPTVLGLFSGAVAKVATATGIDIREESDPKKINSWLIFVDDIKAAAKVPDVVPIMRPIGESDAEYIARVNSWDDNLVLIFNRGIKHGRMHFSTALVNATLLDPGSLERLFLTVLYRSLANLDAGSDHISNSLMNSGWTPHSMPSFQDLKIINAIYSDEFPYQPDTTGGAVDDLVNLLTR